MNFKLLAEIFLLSSILPAAPLGRSFEGEHNNNGILILLLLLCGLENECGHHHHNNHFGFNHSCFDNFARFNDRQNFLRDYDCHCHDRRIFDNHCHDRRNCLC